MDKMRMHTPDITEDNIEKIGQLFPNCLTEKIGEDGSPHQCIDFDVLRQELSKDIVEGAQERYQFTWPDKKKAIRLANAPTTMTLRPCREESVDFDNTQNLYIEGENLEVLKLLRENYLGKIKIIYIDPPYNTGNDFIYNDDFIISHDDYVVGSGQTDENGNQLFQNTESNGRFHSDWLNMIYPRLKVARDLLRDDGAIFVSIDEHEHGNLLKLMFEIFGKDNYIDSIVWDKKASAKGVPPRNLMVNVHEYIVAFQKVLSLSLLVNDAMLKMMASEIPIMTQGGPGAYRISRAPQNPLKRPLLLQIQIRVGNILIPGLSLKNLLRG